MNVTPRITENKGITTACNKPYVTTGGRQSGLGDHGIDDKVDGVHDEGCAL